MAADLSPLLTLHSHTGKTVDNLPLLTPWSLTEMDVDELYYTSHCMCVYVCVFVEEKHALSNKWIGPCRLTGSNEAGGEYNLI